MNDNQAFCLKCGVGAGTGKKFCPNCGNSVVEEAIVCVKCGVSLKPDMTTAQEAKATPPAKEKFNANTEGIAQRSIVTAIILSIVTCGIYSIYWFICLTNEMNKAACRESDTNGLTSWLLNLITCGVYGFYWAYKMGEKRDIIANENGSSHFLYMILTFFGLSIVVCGLAQDSLNKAIDG